MDRWRRIYLLSEKLREQRKRVGSNCTPTILRQLGYKRKYLLWINEEMEFRGLRASELEDLLWGLTSCHTKESRKERDKKEKASEQSS